MPSKNCANASSIWKATQFGHGKHCPSASSRSTGAVRDYFVVENDAGERFWIFRQGDGEHADSGSGSWFLQGIFG
ncbi:hypothetical protein CDO26_35955 (plasmid) [Sinorhizobium meliloti]|nr:hypothetical protein CDO26_35955 [Sinorhizobium meliloti]